MGTPVAIGQDEVIQDLVIVLRRRSSVSGLVRGADGIPIRDMAVVARHSSGTRYSVKSDGTGLYRVYGLAPGTYSMSVEPTTTAKPEPGPMAPVEVKLGAGEERHGVDILLAPAGSGQIRARVVAHDGQAPQSASVSLIGEHETIRRGLVRGAEGFLASGLSPGRYTVTAATYAPPRARGLPSLETLTDRRPTQWAEEIAVVTNGSLSEVVLHLRPTLLFSGQVIIDEPPSTPRSNHPAITLTRIGNPMPPLSAQVASGKFALANVTPGLYRVGVDRSDGWYVSALRTSTVASSPSVEVARARGDLEDVSVTVSRRWSTLSGSLLGTEQSPAIDYWVVAFSVTENLRYPDSPFVQRTRPDTRGIFVFEQLPIGDFHVAVLRDGDADWTHSDFLRRLASSAVRVTLTDRAPTAINLRISR
jgi:hypothetical protein